MPEQDITLRKLEIFLGYMDTMNISKTAEIMHISPVSVHRALHSLEDNLRCDLFTHNGRNLHPLPGAWVMQKHLRLHIRAASDSVADQSAKLRVRDAVLACLDAACPAGNQTDARGWAARNLFTLQLAARHALARCGVNAPVQVQLVNMYFPARQYTGGCLPAGRYDAVRITIGSGSGQNWWCVLYPGLCRAACGGYALPEENDLVCGDYILRLRFVDWWNRHTVSRTTRVLAG